MQIAVVGAGTMGNGIAHVFAQYDHQVTLLDVNSAVVEKGLQTIAGNLERQVRKNKLSSNDAASILKRINGQTELGSLSDAALIVEAASENVETKKTIFRQLDKVAAKEAILASNTSSISITEIAAVTERPHQVIGMHFMNPVPIMRLVELIRGHMTTDAVFNAIRELTLTIDKVPVEVHDFPGFISYRILMPMINEAIFALMEGVASKEAIDEVMKLGMNHPMGPLTLADFIGLDVCLQIMEVLHEGFGDSKYRACPLLRKMVAAGNLGRKSGSGFYNYADA
jgi:3-hydroxybutyryl-CoA dehydrogenase